MAVVITCRELVEFLDDYLSSELFPERRAEFELHLAACPTCVAYMKSYRESVTLGKRVMCSDPDAPAEGVPQDLVRAILAARERKA